MTSVDATLRLRLTTPTGSVLDLQHVTLLLPDGLESWRAPWPGRDVEASKARLSGTGEYDVTIPIGFSAAEFVVRIEATDETGAPWMFDLPVASSTLAGLPVEALSLSVNDAPDLPLSVEKQADLAAAKGGAR